MSELWDEEKESEEVLLDEDIMNDLLDLRPQIKGSSSETFSAHGLFHKRFVRHVEEGHILPSHLDELHGRLSKMYLKDNYPQVSLYDMLKDIEARIQRGRHHCSQEHAKHVLAFVSQVLVKHHELCPAGHIFLKGVLGNLNRHHLT